MSIIIEVKKLSFGYTPQNTILEDISFEIKAGTFVGIAGPNGAGKSTLLNLLCGALKPQSGISGYYWLLIPRRVTKSKTDRTNFRLKVIVKRIACFYSIELIRCHIIGL